MSVLQCDEHCILTTTLAHDFDISHSPTQTDLQVMLAASVLLTLHNQIPGNSGYRLD